MVFNHDLHLCKASYESLHTQSGAPTRVIGHRLDNGGPDALYRYRLTAQVNAIVAKHIILLRAIEYYKQ